MKAVIQSQDGTRYRLVPQSKPTPQHTRHARLKAQPIHAILAGAKAVEPRSWSDLWAVLDPPIEGKKPQSDHAIVAALRDLLDQNLIHAHEHNAAIPYRKGNQGA